MPAKRSRALLPTPMQAPSFNDFRASLVALTGAAYAIEAIYGDIKYLIPEQPRRDSRELFLWHAFNQGFGIPASASHRLLAEFKWLFELRDHAAHPYTEAEPPQQHPAGVNHRRRDIALQRSDQWPGRRTDVRCCSSMRLRHLSPPAVGSSVGSKIVVPTTRPSLPPLSPGAPKSHSTCRRGRRPAWGREPSVDQSRSCLQAGAGVSAQPVRRSPQKLGRHG